MLQQLEQFSVDQPLGQCRAAPVALGPGAPPAFMAAYCADFDVDPYPEMFFLPGDTLKIAVFTLDGRKVWGRDLGRGVLPGMWFAPFLPVDLDGDGADEIFYVGNTGDTHPLSHRCRVLERLDARTGKTTGQWPWPRHLESANPSYAFRNFLLAGMVGGEPVLVTAQGTYGAMYLQGWNREMTPRWAVAIPSDAPGARGSHMTPVVDWDGDGNDEFFWGERLFRFDTGEEVFCADRDSYDGHSDVIQPCLDASAGTWGLYTCRETEHTNHNFPERGRTPIAPRIAFYDTGGRRLWGALDTGHIDMGFVARVGPEREPLAAAVRVGVKSCGPEGRHHKGIEDFFFDGRTGAVLQMPWSPYRVLPADLDGDGCHEFVRGAASGDGALWDVAGRSLGTVGGAVALASKLLPDHPGEQLLSYHGDGVLRLWGCGCGEDSEAARARYAHPFYRANQRLTATGANHVNLGGL